MASKLEAARIASWSGVRTVIANAAAAGRAGRGRRRRRRSAPRFEAHRRKLPARKLWIAFAAQVAGAVTVDDGARRALVERQTSLLPAGVVDVVGRFGEGDTVDVAAPTASAFARGMVFVEAGAAAHGRRPPHQRPPAGMVHEVIHRDDLVLLPGADVRVARHLASAADTLGHVAGQRGRQAGGAARPAAAAAGGLLDGCGAGAAGAAEAELGAQLAEAALGLDVGGGLLDLEHPRLDRRLGAARRSPWPWRSGPGSSPATSVERRHVGADASR